MRFSPQSPDEPELEDETRLILRTIEVMHTSNPSTDSSLAFSGQRNTKSPSVVV